MLWAYELSVWLHVLAACAWVGGMVFLVVVLVPVVKRGDAALAAALIEGSGRRFRTLGWVCLGTLLATGTLNMHFRGIHFGDFFDGSFAQNPVARPLALKLLLFAAVLALSAVHDFLVGPRATAAWRRAPSSPEARAGRRQASLFGRVNGVLALLIVLLAVFVARGGYPS
ncbi:MAG: DUF4149 domain-containing protein [Myxococcaceae bacterium]|nr:DUF4149 domain-containing protein [Myxococcaceae bacterium]